MQTSLNRSIRIARTLMPALLVAAATGFAAAQDGEGRQSRRGARGDFAERDAERMARVLQLTEDQKDQWRRPPRGARSERPPVDASDARHHGTSRERGESREPRSDRRRSVGTGPPRRCASAEGFESPGSRGCDTAARP